jgi:hypothetical protein
VPGDVSLLKKRICSWKSEIIFLNISFFQWIFRQFYSQAVLQFQQIAVSIVVRSKSTRPH